MQLRNYQHDLLERLRGAFRQRFRRPLVVSPTGSGKTVLFSYLCHQLRTNRKRVYVLVHRTELVDQVSRTLAQFDVPHSFIAAGYVHDRREPVQVCGVMSLARRLDRTPPPDYVIIDEAHHATAASTWGKTLACWPDARVIGVTATPQRLSGEGLGETFDTMVLGPTVRELIDAGHLSDFRVYGPKRAIDLDGVKKIAGEFSKSGLADVMSKPAIVGDAVTHYAKHLNGAPAIAFTYSLEAADQLVQQFVSRGWRAAQIDGKMDRALRRSVVDDLGTGQLNVLVSVDVISEGFDVPCVEGALLLRPTWSTSLHLQQVGRALRVAPGKKHAVILDHVGNTARHGFPDDPREWSLLGSATGKKTKKAENAARQCPMCFAVMPAASMRCTECGHTFPVQSREVDQVDGELAEVERQRERKQAAAAQASAQSIEALTELGKLRGFSNPAGWARHVWEGRQKRERRA